MLYQLECYCLLFINGDGVSIATRVQREQADCINNHVSWDGVSIAARVLREQADCINNHVSRASVSIATRMQREQADCINNHVSRPDNLYIIILPSGPSVSLHGAV